MIIASNITKEKMRSVCVSLFKSDGSGEGLASYNIQRGPYGVHGHSVTADERKPGSILASIRRMQK